MGQAENKKKAYQLIKDVMFRKVDFFTLDEKDYEFLFKTYEYEHKKHGQNNKELYNESNMFKASITLFNVVKGRLLPEYFNDVESYNLIAEELNSHSKKMEELLDYDDYLKQYDIFSSNYRL